MENFIQFDSTGNPCYSWFWLFSSRSITNEKNHDDMNAKALKGRIWQSRIIISLERNPRE